MVVHSDLNVMDLASNHSVPGIWQDGKVDRDKQDSFVHRGCHGCSKRLSPLESKMLVGLLMVVTTSSKIQISICSLLLIPP